MSIFLPFEQSLIVIITSAHDEISHLATISSRGYLSLLSFVPIFSICYCWYFAKFLIFFPKPFEIEFESIQKNKYMKVCVVDLAKSINAIMPN